MPNGLQALAGLNQRSQILPDPSSRLKWLSLGDLARSAMAGGLSGSIGGGPLAAFAALANAFDTAREQMYGRDPGMDRVTLAQVPMPGKEDKVSIGFEPFKRWAQTGPYFIDSEGIVARAGEWAGRLATASRASGGKFAFVHHQNEPFPKSEQSEWAATYDASGKRISVDGNPSAEWLASADRAAEAVPAVLSRQESDLKSPLFIRHGNIPEGGRSYNSATGKRESGVSVYKARRSLSDEHGYEICGDYDITAQGTYSQVVSRPAYLVKGDVVGVGGDGEPVLRNVKVVSELKRTASKKYSTK